MKRIVLVRPQGAGNVGSVARVCSNFGLTELVLVNPLCDPFGAEARKYAVGEGLKVLEGARIVPSVFEAIKDCGTAIAFTRRRRKIDETSVDLERIEDVFSAHSAFIFGNEEAGLDAEEIEPCTHLCTIATHPAQPSLNLSHAVALVASRLYRAAEPVVASRATVEELEGFFGHFREFLVFIEMTTAGNPDRVLARVRRLISRAEPSSREVRILRGILAKALR